MWGRAHRIDEGDGQPEEVLQLEPVRRDDLAEGLPLDELHREQKLAFELFDGVERDDVGVVQGGEAAGLAPEARHSVLVPGHLGLQRLERHLTAELEVLGTVNHSHAAASQLFDDPVVAQRAADRSRALPSGACDHTVLSAATLGSAAAARSGRVWLRDAGRSRCRSAL